MKINVQKCRTCKKPIADKGFYWLMGGTRGLSERTANKKGVEAFLSFGYHGNESGSAIKKSSKYYAKTIVEVHGSQFETNFCSKKCLRKHLHL
jgi:hypothetical protein